MKITHSIATLDLSAGGPSRSLPNICIGLKSKGVEQQIVTIETPNPNIEKLTNKKIDVTFIKRKGVDKLGLSYRKAIGKAEGDVFHLHNLWDPILHWAAVKCHNEDKPYVFSPRGTLEPWPLSHKRFKKNLSWAIYQKKDLEGAACIHTTSDMEANNIRKLGIQTPIAIIPNGINIENYSYLKTEESNEKIILFLSRISPKKGIEKLIEAWISIPEELKEGWRIRIAGEGDKGVSSSYFLKIKQIIDNENLNKSVELVGPKYGKDKTEEYKNASLFVLPTYSENFGMVIAEAMVSGVPVITTTGTPWKILNEEKAGWWINNTKEDLRNTLIKAIQLPEESRIEMGLKSRKIIIDNFSNEIVASKYKLLYEWVLNKTSKRPDFII